MPDVRRKAATSTNTGWCDPEQPLTCRNDLVAMLGGQRDGFTAQLLDLVDCADPGQLDRLTKAFPREVLAYTLWQVSSRPWSAGELAGATDTMIRLTS